jgi:hypothetical protein
VVCAMVNGRCRCFERRWRHTWRWECVRPHASSGEVGTASRILGGREEATKAEKAAGTVAAGAGDEGDGSSGGEKRGRGGCQGVGAASDARRHPHAE